MINRFKVIYRRGSSLSYVVDIRYFNDMADLAEWLERANELEYTVIERIIDLKKEEP